MGNDRDHRDGRCGVLEYNPDGAAGTAPTRRHIEAGADRRSVGNAHQGSTDHARLLQGRGIERGGVRRRGYFITGDAVRWVDADRPIEGLEFAGRTAEDFKLLSATWVQASLVRRDLVEALQPYVSDAVICAPDHPWLGALIWLTVPDESKARAGLAKKLAAFNSSRQGSADTIRRLLILKEPPSPEAGEITDKRSINQRLVMERRAREVALLYGDAKDPQIIEPAGAQVQ